MSLEESGSLVTTQPTCRGCKGPFEAITALYRQSEAMANISALVPSCLNGFRSLNDSLPALLPESGLVDSDVPEGLRPSIKNELGRFRVWVTNLGAHRTGRSSLDYRLRDASHIRTQVINLLKDLVECLQDGASIANGTVEPWDNMEPTSDDEDSDSDGPEAQAPSGLTELSQIVSEASEIINCLFRLSVSIHNPAPHDRFRRSAMTDTSHYEAFDTAHIRNKFPSADHGIVKQLGKANSFRRQYFRYREEHHRKLAQGLPKEDMEQPGCDDTKTIGDTTVASSLPQHLKASNSDGSGFEDCDSRSEAGRTETSFAPSSAPDGSRSRVPSMPDEAGNGPFECPFCYRMISVETTKEWRKHVLGDLRPYICLYPYCSAAGQDFQRRYQWIQHVQQAHWKILLCPLGCKDLHIEDIPALEAHLAAFHKEHAETLSLESLIQLCEQERPLDASKKCELCTEELDSFKSYSRHVGRHQEDVALFVLPDRGLDEESLSDDQNEESERAPEHHNNATQDGLPSIHKFADNTTYEDGVRPTVEAPDDTQYRLPPFRQVFKDVPEIHQSPYPTSRPYPSQLPPLYVLPPSRAGRPGISPTMLPIGHFKYRRSDGSIVDEPEPIVPETLASSHKTLGPHYDDTQDGPGSKDGSSASLTAKRQWESDEPDMREVVRNPNYVRYPDGTEPNGPEFIPQGHRPSSQQLRAPQSQAGMMNMAGLNPQQVAMVQQQIALRQQRQQQQQQMAQQLQQQQAAQQAAQQDQPGVSAPGQVGVPLPNPLMPQISQQQLAALSMNPAVIQQINNVTNSLYSKRLPGFAEKWGGEPANIPPDQMEMFKNNCRSHAKSIVIQNFLKTQQQAQEARQREEAEGEAEGEGEPIEISSELSSLSSDFEFSE